MDCAIGCRDIESCVLERIVVIYARDRRFFVASKAAGLPVHPPSFHYHEKTDLPFLFVPYSVFMKKNKKFISAPPFSDSPLSSLSLF